MVKGYGTKGETIKWKYSDEKPYLAENAWDVFNIVQHPLGIDDYEKCEKLTKESETHLKKLNPEYTPKDFDIYDDLSSLKPYIAVRD